MMDMNVETMKDIEGVEVLIDYHNVGCDMYNNHNRERPDYCKPDYRAGYYYNYELVYAAINSCAYHSISQIEVLNRCVEAIRGKSRSRWVYSTMESSPQFYKQVDRDIVKGEVMEVMSTGGFNRSYYIFHKIGDIDVEHLKSIRHNLDYKSVLWCNVVHAFKVLGLTEYIEEMMPEGLTKDYARENFKYA